MTSIHRCDLPPDALLTTYRREGAYTDCYATAIAWRVSHAEYVEAFYTTALFKAERVVLAWLVAKPSTDDEARRLADGTLDSFAAWRVEARGTDQLLMSDFQGRTRSWLMVTPAVGMGAEGTRLYFGSAVAAVVNARTGQRTLGLAFRVLLGLHKLYSRALLFAVKCRLTRQHHRRNA
ncbi:hypothetical protein [Roseateles sp.]|uniref:hypothetical protein n=1 Tax=Roseateles sp. TaxID=1971397 RepID=UPI00286C16C5|nr:hypothetical protein [Roseateles sp.]